MSKSKAVKNNITPQTFDPANPMHLPNFGLSCRAGRLVNALDAALPCLELKEQLSAFQIINDLNEWSSVGKDNWKEKLPKEFLPNHCLGYRLSIRNKLWMDSIILKLKAKGKDGLAKDVQQRRDELLADVEDLRGNTEHVQDDLASKQQGEKEPAKASGEAVDNMQATSKTTKLKVEDKPDQVFIVYSHKDKRWVDDLQTHLKPYVRNGSLTAWSDKQIAPGSKWFPEIEAALASTKVAVLLVTPDFLASDFIHESELGPLLKKAVKGKLSIIWVPVRSCSYKETPLKDYQAAGHLDKPLANMKKADRDKAWVRICEQIKKAVSR